MSAPICKTFRAVLEPTGTRLRWVIARVPVDLKKAWPTWRSRRVRGEINGFAFQTSLFPGQQGGGHVLLVNKRMQTGARAKPGETVQIRLEPDLEEQAAVPLPKELVSALKADRRLCHWFDALSPSMRKWIGAFVDEAKGIETRKLRASRMAESLLLAMEGEEEPPPILRAAFLRQPQAREGWNAMTPTRRRNHLLGIFFVQTVEAREKRAAKAVEEALQAARKASADRE
ncbi:MAG: YdeI/OmpD-associated family protein [Terracidiphilus sp.]